MDQMLINLKLMGILPWDQQDLTKLKRYCEAVSIATGVPIPANYPVWAMTPSARPPACTPP